MRASEPMGVFMIYSNGKTCCHGVSRVRISALILHSESVVKMMTESGLLGPRLPVCMHTHFLSGLRRTCSRLQPFCGPICPLLLEPPKINSPLPIPPPSLTDTTHSHMLVCLRWVSAASASGARVCGCVCVSDNRRLQLGSGLITPSARCRQVGVRFGLISMKRPSASSRAQVGVTSFS